MRQALLLFLLAAVLASSGSAAGASAPPGATARCKDGTYSYAKHHSGACSHHGGVAAWLDGSGSSGSGRSGSKTTPIKLGRTILLSKRSRTSGCTLGPKPDRRCSPGSYYSKLTKAVICSSSFHTSAIRDVPQSEKYAVEQEYALAPKLYGYTLEIDHIVSLELGGSNNIANLYPEEATFADHAPGYHVKDKFENRLHTLVCSEQMTLRAAQRGIAGNWEALYRKVYSTAP